MPLIRNNTDEWIITPAEKSALSALLCWSIHYSREVHVVLDKREGTELQDGNLPFLFDVDCGKIKCLDRFSSCGKCERGNCFKRKIWKQRKSLFSILRREKKSSLIMVWLWWFQEFVSLGIYLLFTNSIICDRSRTVHAVFFCFSSKLVTGPRTSVTRLLNQRN